MSSFPRIFLSLLLLTLVFIPFNNSHSGGLILPLSETDTNVYQLYSFFDLRNRESFIQVTNPEGARTVHVQVFDVSNLCAENNFFDDYTPNDTHVYNMRDIETNDGDPSGVDLAAGAYGFVVVTAVLGEGQPADTDGEIIGNFRVLDDSGYEYRTNSQNGTLLDELSGNQLTFNYSSAGGINESDVIGITVNNIDSGEVTASISGVTFDTNLYNNNEVPFSCSNTTFSCTENTFEYGINDALPSSREGVVTCGSNIIDEGFVVLDRITSNDTELFAGYVGLNTGGSSRGSMDSMWTESSDELTMLSQICSDGIDNNDNGFTDCMDQACDGTVVDTGGGEFTCESSSEMICDDGFDNDENGFTDCMDQGCDGTTVDTGGGPFVCEPMGETSCEDGFDNDNNGLTDCEDPNCQELTCECREFCRVFVTNGNIFLTGNLGGVAGADTICQNTADSSGLTQGGTYLAWISDSLGNSPDTNFNKVTVPYQLVFNGIVVANNYADLINCENPGCLINPININEMGIFTYAFPWTGTNSDGTSAGSPNCLNWTTDDPPPIGIRGDLTSTTSTWTNDSAESCNNPESIYCFEQ